jgi:hypothetical protein
MQKVGLLYWHKSMSFSGIFFSSKEQAPGFFDEKKANQLFCILFD